VLVSRVVFTRERARESERASERDGGGVLRVGVVLFHKTRDAPRPSRWLMICERP